LLVTKQGAYLNIRESEIIILTLQPNDHTIGWQNLNLLSHANATLAQQARQARASGENMNFLLSL